MAEILQWLVLKFDPATSVPLDISTVDERVKFIKDVAQLIMTKTSLKVNTKKLYQADGHAVQEMLKICEYLEQALRSSQKNQEDADDELPISESEIISKVCFLLI